MVTEEEARYFQDKATLESPDVLKLIPHSSKRLKILNVLPENHRKWKEEHDRKNYIQDIRDKVQDWVERWESDKEGVTHEIVEVTKDKVYTRKELKDWVIEKYKEKKREDDLMNGDSNQEESDQKKLSKEETSVLLKENYDNIKSILKYYVDLKEDYYDILTLWIIGTYLHDNFVTFPYLFFNAMKGSGKSRTLKLVTTLSKNGQLMASPTEAVLFRTNGTLGIDEFEGVASKEKQAIRELLNAGYKKGVTIQRLKKKKTIDGEEHIIEEFEPYRPIVMVNIAGMDEVLEDRCITLILEKSNNPAITKLIEDFSTQKGVEMVLKSLVKCIVCSECSKKNLYTSFFSSWNSFIKNKSSVDIDNYTLSTYTTLDTHTTDTTPENTLNSTSFFEKVDDSGIQGRSLELFFPLFVVADMISEELLDKTIRIGAEIIKDKTKETTFENRDVMLLEFVSQRSSEMGYYSVKQLTNEFREFIDENDDDINSKWLGLALRRLSLIVDKKRKSSGVEVVLNVAKARSKLTMFKTEEEEKEE